MGKVLKNVSKISGIYGQPGEEKVSSLLEKELPDDYLILNSPRISYHGATIDIDHVIIGPNGIFAVESKNMQGKIFGGLMGNWTQERNKTGKNKRVKIGNPANQVNHYSKIVKSFLTVRYLNDIGNKVKVKVYPIVVFAHQEIDLSELDYTRNGFVGRVKVLKLDDLIDFIKTREGANYSKEDVGSFAEILVPKEQRDQTEYFEPGFLVKQREHFDQRYELYDEIGRGNYGTVYRGFDFKLDREVAIKKMHSSQKDPDAIKRFFREAQINAKLSHENIVSVYDYYEENNGYYLIMEFIDGHTLEELIKDKNLELSNVFEIMDSICAALEHSHENHVIHRDLKPSNILITTDKKVKVSDFGIARLTENGVKTQTMGSLGTPFIMAPEQISGTEIDERTDVFGLGILLYLLLTSNYPFNGEHVGEIVNKILYHDPISFSDHNASIPRRIEKVVLKCLEKEPKDRFQSVSELREALHAVFIEERDYVEVGFQDNKFIINGKKVLTTITVVTLVFIVSLISYQAYVDSRHANSQHLQTEQYGFTNDNLRALYAEPNKFTGVPVNLVGKIGKILQLTNNMTMFSVIVDEGNNQTKHIIVEYQQPHFMMQYAQYIKITGSVKSEQNIKDNDNTPVIIADKVEPIADPWSILAPTLLALHPDKEKNLDGKAVQLNRVEFAAKETRLFITIKNYTDEKAYFILSNPLGRQGKQIAEEIPNRYGVFSKATLELGPREYAKEVIFLEAMDINQKTARFVFGSDLNIVDPQKPYIFEVNW